MIFIRVLCLTGTTFLPVYIAKSRTSACTCIPIAKVKKMRCYLTETCACHFYAQRLFADWSMNHVRLFARKKKWQGGVRHQVI